MSKWRSFVGHCIGGRSALALLLLATSVGNAQTTTTYSYDNLQRVTQGASSDGSSNQYLYDANGNLLTLTRTNAGALILNRTLAVNLAVPGQSASLSFTATAGQSVTITLGSVSTSPANGTVTLSVYNSSGMLVGSTTATVGAALALSGLAAGNYSVVIAPPSATTGVAQITLAAPPPASDANGPLPLWALLALGSGLLGVIRRVGGHSLTPG